MGERWWGEPEPPSIEEQEWQLRQEVERRAAERRFDEGFAEYEASAFIEDLT